MAANDLDRADGLGSDPAPSAELIRVIDDLRVRNRSVFDALVTAKGSLERYIDECSEIETRLSKLREKAAKDLS